MAAMEWGENYVEKQCTRHILLSSTSIRTSAKADGKLNKHQVEHVLKGGLARLSRKKNNRMTTKELCFKNFTMGDRICEGCTWH